MPRKPSRKAIRSYVRLLESTVLNASRDIAPDTGGIILLAHVAEMLGRSNDQFLCDVRTVKLVHECRCTIARRDHAQSMIAAIFDVLRAYTSSHPDGPDLMRKLRGIYQSNGTYAILARLRDDAERAHTELAALTAKHPDLLTCKRNIR